MIFRILVGCVVLVTIFFLYQMYGYRYVLDDIRQTASSATIMGSEAAPINILAYLDYGSSWSRRANPVLLQVLSENPDVNLIIRPYPGVSESSRFAARLALAAIEDNDFLDVHTILMEAPNDLPEEYLKQAIFRSGLNYDKLANRAYDDHISQIIKDTKTEALLLGVDKTPHIYIEHIPLESGGSSFADMEDIINDIRRGYR
jgi:protein-disulfide isomerase